MDPKNDVVLVPRADLAVLVVKGADRQSWLNGLVTCDLAKATAARASYGLATTQKGRVLADVIVVIDPDVLRVVVPADRRDALKSALEKYLIMEDVELELGTDVVAIAHGPEWRKLAREGVTVVEYDELGFGGALALGPSLDALDVPRADPIAWEALRVERGVPRFGVDFDETTYPQEAALEKRAVSFDKGCYLGQEVVCMLELRGHVKRKLARVSIDGTALPTKGAVVTDDSGAEVGSLTSAAISLENGQIVGLAMLKLAKTEPGTSLHIGPTTVHVR